MEHMLLGTSTYHVAVVETDRTFYPTIRHVPTGTIRYAQIDPQTGRYVPSKYIVGGGSTGETENNNNEHDPDFIDDYVPNAWKTNIVNGRSNKKRNNTNNYWKHNDGTDEDVIDSCYSHNHPRNYLVQVSI